MIMLEMPGFTSCKAGIPTVARTYNKLMLRTGDVVMLKLNGKASMVCVVLVNVNTGHEYLTGLYTSKIKGGKVGDYTVHKICRYDLVEPGITICDVKYEKYVD